MALDIERLFCYIGGMNAKYIIVQEPFGLEYPFIFSPIIKHSDFARSVPVAGKVISAGFISFGEGGFACYGESISLGVKSRNDKDTEVFQRSYQGI